MANLPIKTHNALDLNFGGSARVIGIEAGQVAGGLSLAQILVAEDELHIFKMLDFRLKNLGHEIIGAVDGGKALEIAPKEKPDLVLLDIALLELHQLPTTPTSTLERSH